MSLSAPPRARDLLVLTTLLCAFAIPYTTAQTTLFSEDFDNDSGTTGNSAEGVSWSSSGGNGQVDENRFRVAQAGAGTWTTGAISIAAYANLEISCDVIEEGDLESDDCFSLEVFVDGESAFIYSHCGNNPSDIPLGLIAETGSVAVIVVTATTNYCGWFGCERWFIDNVTLTGESSAVTGCTDPAACNYDSTPTTDTDNSLCTYVNDVCETCENGVIVDNDADDDGVCDVEEVTGCTDATACNYDATPTIDTDNALCVYASGCDTCSGQTDGTGTVVEGDQNDNGICDGQEDGCISTLEGSLATSLSGEESDTLWFAVDSGYASTVFLNLEWVRYSGTSQGENPADLLIQILDGNGDCVGFGGEEGWSLSGCTGLGDGPTAYNEDWTIGGQYASVQDTIDVSSAGLAGVGDWKVVLTNGNTAAGLVTYSLDVGIASVCGVQKVAGCTDDSACNYDPAAEEDNGTCVFAEGEGGCACQISGAVTDTLDYLSPVGTPVQFQANSVDGPQLLTMALDYTNVDANDLAWPSDMAVRILDPSGNCSWFGGYDFDAADVPGCDAEDEWTVGWPPSGWNSPQSGGYAAILDLSASGLTGSGTWTITLLNGWSGVSTGGQTDNEAIYDLDWSLTGLCALGCTDPTACNYDANAVVDDGTCASTELLDYFPFASPSFTLELDTSGVVFLDEATFWSTLGVDASCGVFCYEFVEDGCDVTGQEMPSFTTPGNYSYQVKVFDETGPPVNLGISVLVSATAYSGCTDFAACNFNQPELGSDCIYPGEVGWCDNPSGANGFLLERAAGSDSCACSARPFDVLFFENFDAGGEVDQFAATVLTEGVGYEGFATSSDAYTGQPFASHWTVGFASPLIGDGNVAGNEPGYWYTVDDGFGDGMYFDGYWLDFEATWTSREVDVSGLQWVQMETSFAQFNDDVEDYVQAELMETASGTVLSTVEHADGTANGVWASGESLVEIAEVSGVQLSVRALNNASNEYHSFDDVRISGWGREGCTDARATAASYDATAHVDDGSCVYDQDTVFAQYTGFHTARIWSDTAVTAKQRLGGFAQALDMTTSLVVSEGCQITANPNGADLGEVHVNDLRIEENGAFYLPAGTELHVHGDYCPMGERGVFGPGELHVHGDWDWSGQTGTDRLALDDLVLEEGASLEVPAGKMLAVCGDMSFPASMGTVSGTVMLEGDAQQMLSAASGSAVRMDNLFVDKCTTAENAEVVVASPLEVQGRLCLMNGSLDLGSDSLKFMSNAAGTGVLDAIPATAELSGSAETGAVASAIERYIAPDDDGVTFTGYTLFAAPLEGLTVGDLEDIEGFYLAGFPGTDWPNSFSTVLFWDEVNSEFIEPTTLQTPLDTLGGVWIAIAGSQNPTMSTGGALRSHSAEDVWSKVLTRSETANPVYRGWNLIQNPYQAQLDWNAIRDLNPGVEDQYAIYDTQAKAFQRYGTGALDSLQINGNRYIQPGNSFWVRVRADSAQTTFTLPPSVIDNAPEGGPFVRSEEEGAEVLLALDNAYGTGHLWLRFSETGTVEYVHGRDASFLPSSSVRHGQLALETAHGDFVTKSLPTEVEAGLRVISRANLESTLRVVRASADVCGRIVDQQTGAVLELVEGEEMAFTLPAHEADSGRFTITTHDWARTSALMPSCPEAVDGRVEVAVADHAVHVALTTADGQVLDQVVDASSDVAFIVPPGEYGVTVTSTDGVCPKVHRPVVVPPGEQPELLGLDWTVPPCNEGHAEVAFELYGGGIFSWALAHEDGEVVRQGMGQGEFAESGLAAGTYILEVDHACLSESATIEASDPGAPTPQAEWDPVVVLGEDGQAVWQALCTTPGVEACRWGLPDGTWVESALLEWTVATVGAHEVLLEVEANGCTAVQTIAFTAVSSLRMPASSSWSVSTHNGHWRFSHDGLEGPVEWTLVDAAGRHLERGRWMGPGSFVVTFPAVRGVYWVLLSAPNSKTSERVLRP